MQPAIDLLTVAQFLAGIALIPMVIVAELLSFRISKNSRISPCGDGEEDEESGQRGGKQCEYAVALTDSTGTGPGTPELRHSITATIADSPNSTPDFNARRSMLGYSQGADSTPVQQQQNYVLPPLKNNRYSNASQPD